MAATPYSIPRGKRITDVLAGNGGKTYGPFAFKIFDIEDVEVVARPQGAAKYSVAAVTVQKVSNASLDYFTITFSDNVPASTSFQVRGRRVAERSAGVMKGTLLNPDALERELSKISLQAQEARRDALPLDPDIQEGDTLAWSPTGWRRGANADDIAGAQVYAAEALVSKQNAAGFAAQAQGSATAASGSANLAGRWATAPENEEVVPTSGLFSAYHWYRKTLAIWNSVITGWSGAVHDAPLKESPSLADEFGFADSGDSWKIKKQTFAKLQEVFGVPIGTAIMMPGNGNNPPPGFLLMNGAPCTSAYPQLRAWLLANGATVNGNGDPIIEDMGGYFPRGWRAGQVVDSGRAFGVSQLDALQGHRHPVNKVTNATVSDVVNNNQVGNVHFVVDGYVNEAQPQANGHGPSLPDGSNGAPRVAAETRPINKTFTYWIKAYGAEQVPGSADFSALANSVQVLQNAVNSKGSKRQASITPSGNAFTLSGLPAGVQRVLLKLSGIQLASNAQIVVRLGTAAGVETSAGRYFSKAVGFAATSLAESSLTTGFLLNDGSVGSALTIANYGVIELQRQAPGSNSWELSGTMTRGNSGQNIFVGGATLLDDLTQIQFTTTAGNIAFSGNNSVAIEWEF
ncbi:hypothetical protein ASF91_15025 [Rhizobium sp. Leaf155]|nr:hypothetical protein ASF91_15025 [Rhizobium sp. Leaf155]